MGHLLSNVMSLVSICLVLGLYAKLPGTVPITMAQVQAANNACASHLGVKHYLEQSDPQGFKAICNDDSTIAGKLSTYTRTKEHRT